MPSGSALICLALLNVDQIDGDRIRWCGPELSGSSRLAVQVRAHGDAVPGIVTVEDSRVTALLDDPLRGVASGQAMVMYDGTHVVGSATITRATRRSTAAL